MSSAQRVTRSIRHLDMGTVDATATTLPFSIGTTATNEESLTPPVARRSTRRAAALASNRIALGTVTQRRSTRVAVRNADAARTGGGGREAPSPASRIVSSATRARGTKDTPIVLDDDEIEEMDLKPAAVVGGKIVVGAAISTAQKPPADFTCAICLDAPSSMTEVASLDGCTHRFCFDCIDKWAMTENKCPCCKARFRTIDRVAKLEAASPARRGKRKRAATTASQGSTPRARRGGGSSSPARTRRVNSRAVEDRNQQTLSTFPINAAIVEQILASFSNFGGPRRGTGQVTFGTSEDGRPAIRMIRPASGGMVGVMEMLLPDDIAEEEGGNGPAAAGSAAARGHGAAPGRSGSGTTRMAHVRFSRVSSSSRGGSSLPTAPGPRAPSVAAARGSGAATARPASSSSRAARQGTTSFASLYASYGSSTMASPRGRRAADGAALAASSSGAGGNSSMRSNRMTIRAVPRERVAGSRASGSGADPDEPIIID
jgi:hypothetical protein